jgi:hypothetical protein
VVAKPTDGCVEEGAAGRSVSSSPVAMVVVVVSGCGGSDVTSDVVIAPELVGFGTDVSTDDPHAAMVAAKRIVVMVRTIIVRV